MTDPNDQKRIVARSRGTYRGIVIIEVSTGYLIYIGAKMYGFESLPETTAFIDAYYATKRN